MKVEGETAYCIDINTDFKNGYKTRADASSRMSTDQISDVALSLEYVKQYGEAHKELNYKQVYLLQLHNHTDIDWCLCIGRFSVLPLLLRQFQEAPAPSKAGKNGTGKQVV